MVYHIFTMLYMLVLQYILNIVLRHGYKGRQIQLCASKKFYLKHVESNHATFFSLWFWCYWKASARWPVLCCPLLHQGTFPEHQLKIEETVLSYVFLLQYLSASSFGKEGYVFGNVGLFVCLWATLLKKLWTDCSGIVWRGPCGTVKNSYWLNFGGNMDPLTWVNEQNMFKSGKFGSLLFNKFRHNSEPWLSLLSQGRPN